MQIFAIMNYPQTIFAGFRNTQDGEQKTLRGSFELLSQLPLNPSTLKDFGKTFW